MKSETRGLGKRIQKARRQKNISQEVLAEAVNVSVHHISSIETGKNLPSLDVFVDILNYLEVTPNEILCDGVEAARPILLKETEELFAGFAAGDVKFLQGVAGLLKDRVKTAEEE